MSVLIEQIAVGTSAVQVAVIPPGPCNVTVTVGSAGGGVTPLDVVYFGTSNSVTISNGAPVVSNATVTIYGYEGSRGWILYAVASAANTPVGVIVSTGS